MAGSPEEQRAPAVFLSHRDGRGEVRAALMSASRIAGDYDGGALT